MIVIEEGLIRVSQLTQEEKIRLSNEWAERYYLEVDDWMLAIPIETYAKTQPIEDSLVAVEQHELAVIAELSVLSAPSDEDKMEVTMLREKYRQDSVKGKKYNLIKDIYRESHEKIQELKRVFLTAQYAEDGDKTLERLANKVIRYQRIQANARGELISGNVEPAYWEIAPDEVEALGQGIERRALEDASMQMQLGMPSNVITVNAEDD